MTFKLAKSLAGISQALFRFLILGVFLVLANCGGGGGAGDSSATTQPQSATLSWSDVNAGNLSGYRVYFGTTSGTYFQVRGQGLDAGLATTFTVVGLRSRSRYYFAVTGYDSVSGFESGYSNEVFKETP